MNDNIKYYELLISELLKQKNIDFIMLGSLLHNLKTSEIYKQNELYNKPKAKAFYLFVKDKFNLSKTITSNYIAVFLTFANDNLKLKNNYLSFNFSQLSAMLSLSDTDLMLITPQMSVSQINKIKNKSLKTLKVSALTQNRVVTFENKVLNNLKAFVKSDNAKTFNIVVNEAIKEYLKNKGGEKHA